MLRTYNTHSFPESSGCASTTNVMSVFERAGLAGAGRRISSSLRVRECMRECVSEGVKECVRACVRACVCVCGCALTYRRKHKGLAMGLIRNPRTRILSAFNANFHHYGMAKAESMKMKAQLLGLLGRNKSALALQQFAEWPGIAHCVTKMLLGVYCAINRDILTKDVGKAIDNLRAFAFVGEYICGAAVPVCRPFVCRLHTPGCPWRPLQLKGPVL